jgi:hypothetical protein
MKREGTTYARARLSNQAANSGKSSKNVISSKNNYCSFIKECLRLASRIKLFPWIGV